jgi:hypothetical protein
LKLKNLNNNNGVLPPSYYSSSASSDNGVDCCFDFGFSGSPPTTTSSSNDVINSGVTSTAEEVTDAGKLMSPLELESGCVLSSRTLSPEDNLSPNIDDVLHNSSFEFPNDDNSSDSSVYYDVQDNDGVVIPPPLITEPENGGVIPPPLIIEPEDVNDVKGNDTQDDVTEPPNDKVNDAENDDAESSDSYSLPHRIQRSSSLKTGKTPPGTPGRKKIVRFADVLGLDLADVRTFLDEIPNVPTSAFRLVVQHNNYITIKY